MLKNLEQVLPLKDKRVYQMLQQIEKHLAGPGVGLEITLKHPKDLIIICYHLNNMLEESRRENRCCKNQRRARA